MRDVITYTNHTDGLQAKLDNNRNLFKQILESKDGKLWINWNTIPVEQTSQNSVALIRVSDLDLVNAIGFEILANVPMGESAFDALDADGLEKLYLAYDKTPIEWTDDEGVLQYYPKPEFPGVFA